MSYNIEELFRFEYKDYANGYIIDEYLKPDDPSITEFELPAEFNGKPVTAVGYNSFEDSEYIKRVVFPQSVHSVYKKAFFNSSIEEIELSENLTTISYKAFAFSELKSIRLPKSLDEIRRGAFLGCDNLERVELNSSPILENEVFCGCPKLPAETVVMGLVCSTDITCPIFIDEFSPLERFGAEVYSDCFRPDVFRLLAKNNCFRSCDLLNLLKQIIKENKPGLFPVAERYGMLDDAELLEELISYVIERKNVELTAYLLELKNRKFGFEGGSGLEL